MSIDEIFSCKGKVAIVSGGAGLYGFAISEALCQAGATVVVGSRSDALLRTKVAGLREKLPLHHHELDLRDESSIDRLFRDVERDFHRVDIVVNNALTPVGATLEETSSDRWMQSMQGNVVGLFMMCRRAAAVMQRQKSGSIINISSIWGAVAPDFQSYAETQTQPNPVDYGFIKGGMIMFTRTLASQLGKDQVRVNCILPGGISDDTVSETYRSSYARKVPLGRWAIPEDIKGAIVFLASGASAYVTGTNVVVDGGYTAL